MPPESFEATLVSTMSRALDDGPLFECTPPIADDSGRGHRIRARRFYPVPPEAVFDAWTSRGAWDSWMRLRARARATIATTAGGAFRLDLAEGPTIHVITGTVAEIRPPELLSLAWTHHDTSDRPSSLQLSVREFRGITELSLVHAYIESRREASWLMRLWPRALDRLGDYLGAYVRFRERVPLAISRQ